jgi:hypothetical protein
MKDINLKLIQFNNDLSQYQNGLGRELIIKWNDLFKQLLSSNQSDVSDELLKKAYTAGNSNAKMPEDCWETLDEEFVEFLRDTPTPKKEERNNRCSYDVVTCKYRGENQNCSNQGFCIGMLSLFAPPIKDKKEKVIGTITLGQTRRNFCDKCGAKWDYMSEYCPKCKKQF